LIFTVYAAASAARFAQAPPLPFQESMRPGLGGRRGDFFAHRNADMLDPWPK
jgi:hypothetical protein